MDIISLAVPEGKQKRIRLLAPNSQSFSGSGYPVLRLLYRKDRTHLASVWGRKSETERLCCSWMISPSQASFEKNGEVKSQQFSLGFSRDDGRRSDRFHAPREREEARI
uniref:Uncharacterized protein n=1 Tax=Nelumbo nucifera TaxID=4432 RepID=A0A822XS28_NELNU|nr:TPA_asm: hypothetical protein HUJ06_023078 [Nelumbo nucifera]